MHKVKLISGFAEFKNEILIVTMEGMHNLKSMLDTLHVIIDLIPQEQKVAYIFSDFRMAKFDLSLEDVQEIAKLMSVKTKRFEVVYDALICEDIEDMSKAFFYEGIIRGKNYCPNVFSFPDAGLNWLKEKKK